MIYGRAEDKSVDLASLNIYFPTEAQNPGLALTGEELPVDEMTTFIMTEDSEVSAAAEEVFEANDVMSDVVEDILNVFISAD